LLAIGCSSDAEGDSQPAACDPSARTGTYYMEFSTVSGNCGEQASGLGRLDSSFAPEGGCQITQPDRWSDGNCKLERSVLCPFDALEPGATITSVGITTQKDANGDVLEGTMSMTVKYADGRGRCYGTYSMRATKQ
jgi:hypothetical protein